MKHALVTGATGFIGEHVVKRLTHQGYRVTCLARGSSDRRRLEPFQPRFVIGNITDRQSVGPALSGVDVVFHLAGATKSLLAKGYSRVNEQGVRNIAEACAAQDQPPVLVVVSSLAAAGPAAGGDPRVETDVESPSSNYGRSKRAGELAAMEWAASVPITIVRPPIVLGEGDRDGLAMFKSIADWGIHLVPGRRDPKVSVIHAEDLANALVLAADRGRRLAPHRAGTEGIYFASADEMPTYGELGRIIGKALGRQRVLVIRTGKAAVWSIAAINEFVSQVRRAPHILSLDKARDATAGSWICSAAALRSDTGFVPILPLDQRIEQTARWYIDQGWLRQPRHFMKSDDPRIQFPGH